MKMRGEEKLITEVIINSLGIIMINISFSKNSCNEENTNISHVIVPGEVVGKGDAHISCNQEKGASLKMIIPD